MDEQRLAEETIARLNAHGALKRRQASFEEIKPYSLWRPSRMRGEGPWSEDYLFASMSEFLEEILPQAQRVYLRPPRTVRARGLLKDLGQCVLENYGCITTAVEANASPILNWDMEDKPCPFAWHIIRQLVAASYICHEEPEEDVSFQIPVRGIFNLPSKWGHRKGRYDGVFFALTIERPIPITSLVLPTEILKPELRRVYEHVRDVMEEFEPPEVTDPAQGVFRVKDAVASLEPIELIVRLSGGREEFVNIDRWD